MTPEFAVSIVSHTTWIVVVMVSVLVLPSLIVGLVVATFQAVTQINEQTLSFLPRLITTFIVFIIAGHWLLQEITTLFNYIFNSIPTNLG